MLRISKKVEYGLMILTRLVEAKGQLLSTAQIAHSYGISRPLAANVLKTMNQRGIVASVRGVKGGYRLLAKPAELTLARLIHVLEGPFAVSECKEASSPEEGCDCQAKCPIKRSIGKLQDWIEEFLQSITCDRLLGESTPVVPCPPPPETKK